jgi:uncharacterized protein YycO
MLVLYIWIGTLVLGLLAPLPAHAGGGDGILGHLYAGTSDPALVYRYVGGTDWEAISPLPRAEPLDPLRADPSPRQYLDSHNRTPLGRAVLDLIHHEGHLYAGTVSENGTGQVWRHDGGIAWTLVGDDLDDRVSSLETYQGSLYAATGASGELAESACVSRVYRYNPGSSEGPADDWTLQADRTACCGGISEDQVLATVASSCVHDYVEHRGEAYLATDDALMRRRPEEASWQPALTLDDDQVRQLETLDGWLYAGYDSGELRVSDGDDWPGELVFTAPEGIRSLATDQLALYVGTGSGPASRAVAGKVYRLADPHGSPEAISSNLGASIQALHAVGPSGLDLSVLERGDILLVRGPGVIEGVIGFVATWLGGSYWIHGGMYAGEGIVVESSSAVADDFGMVRTTTITETLFWQEENYWAAIRVTQQDARDGATSYAEGQVGDLYNVDYPFWGLPIQQICQLLQPIIGIDPAVCCAHPVTDRETEDDCFYCTHLPWRAYHTQGIDLDSDAAWPARLFAAQAIPGDDLYYDDDVTLVDQKRGMQAVIVSAVGSPADMLVIDAQGRRTGVDPETGEILDEIPEITYGRMDLPLVLDFFLPDQWESDFVAIPNLDETWEIQILGTKRGSYQLGAELVDWQHHHTQTFTRTTEAGQIDTFQLEYPEQPQALIIRASEVYLPLVIRGH